VCSFDTTWSKAFRKPQSLSAWASAVAPYPPRPTKLDPYHALIREFLDTYPELTAVRLFDEVRAEGLTVVAAVKTR